MRAGSDIFSVIILYILYLYAEQEDVNRDL